MEYLKYSGESAGFWAVGNKEDDLPILQGGEVWTPGQWSIDWHRHRGWEFYFQSKGVSKWSTLDGSFEIQINGAYLIKPGIKHRLDRFEDGGGHFYWISFPQSSVPKSLRCCDCWRREVSKFTNAGDLLLPLQGLIRELVVKEKHQNEACKSYLNAICIALTRLDEQRPKKNELARHPSAERCLRIMNCRYDHPWRLEELARLSGVSTPHLIDVFHNEYGTTPMRMLLRIRLDEAARRLKQTEKSITEIANELCFSSSQHFARACRNQFGQSPTQIRGDRQSM